MKEESIERAKTLGDWAYLGIEKHFQKILKHEDLVLKDKEPEELHQMRVGMRRLRSAVTGFALAVKLPKDAKEKPIGKVARILGDLRDLDVLKETIEQRYQPTLPAAENKRVKVVLERLEKQRSQALEAVKSVLEGKKYQDLKQAFKKWLAEPKYQQLASVDIREILPSLLLPTVSQLLLHPAWWIGLDSNDGEGIDRAEELLTTNAKLFHDLRKQTKRSRYQMELFADLYGDNYQDYIADIKAIQEVLGTIQDSFVLGDFLGKTLDLDQKDRLPTLFDRLDQNRYDSWKEWQILQQKYVTRETRQDLYLQLLNPVISSPNS
ncbi:MAG: CHAD domain-containing protein [Cyanosarcina radialis HA8281-LM2]|jgi:CHAD domain-containing protein|nr:CHAD domain-containing protein [Cyanosarcina radialis HA8281-LM2]